MLWLSLTGKLSHVPSVVLSMLEKNHKADVYTSFDGRAQDTVPRRALKCADVNPPGRNSNSVMSSVPRTRKRRRVQVRIINYD